MLRVIKVLLYIAIFGALATPMVVAPTLLTYISTFPQAMYFRILVEIALVLWAILFFFKRVTLPGSSMILWSTAGFFAILTLASIFGFNPARSLWGTLSRAEGLFTLLHFFSFFLLLISLFRNSAQWQWVLRVIAMISIPIGIVAILQTFGIFTLQGGGCGLEGCTRVNGTFSNTAYYGSYLVMIIFLAIFLAVYEKKRIWQWGFGLLALVNTILLLMTGTRAGWVAVAIGLVFLAIGWFCRLPKEAKRKRIVLLGVVLVISLALLGSYLIPQFGWVKQGTILTTLHDRIDALALSALAGDENRFFVWQIGIQAWKEHPWLGSGLESFAYNWERLYDPKLYVGEHLVIEPFYNRAHNVWIDLLVNTGVLGLAAYFFLLAIAIRTAVRASLQISMYGILVLIAFFAAHEIHNFFSFNTMSAQLIFFTVLGFLHTQTLASKLQKQHISTRYRFFNPVFALIMIGAIPVILFFYNIQPVRANMAFMRGFHGQTAREVVAYLNQTKTYNLPVTMRAEIQWLSILRLNGELAALLPQDQENEAVLQTKRILAKTLDTFMPQIRDYADFKVDGDRLRMYSLLMSTYGLLYNLTEDKNYLEQGKTAIQQALSINPRHPSIFQPAAELFLLDRDLSRTLDMYAKAFAASHERNPIQYLQWQGKAYILTGSTKEERAQGVWLYLRFLKLNDFYTSRQFDPGVLQMLASIYEQDGNFAKIVEIHEESLALLPKTLVPNDYQFYGTLARAYLKIGKHAKARETLAIAKQLFPKFAKELDRYLVPIP